MIRLVAFAAFGAFSFAVAGFFHFRLEVNTERVVRRLVRTRVFRAMAWVVAVLLSLITAALSVLFVLFEGDVSTGRAQDIAAAPLGTVLVFVGTSTFLLTRYLYKTKHWRHAIQQPTQSVPRRKD